MIELEFCLVLENSDDSNDVMWKKYVKGKVNTVLHSTHIARSCEKCTCSFVKKESKKKEWYFSISIIASFVLPLEPSSFYCCFFFLLKTINRWRRHYYYYFFANFVSIVFCPLLCCLLLLFSSCVYAPVGLIKASNGINNSSNSWFIYPLTKQCIHLPMLASVSVLVSCVCAPVQSTCLSYISTVVNTRTHTHMTKSSQQEHFFLVEVQHIFYFC